MKTCYIYSFITPVDNEVIIDNKDIPPLGVVTVNLKDGRIFEAAILGTPNTIKAFRLAIPNIENDTLGPEDRRRFFDLRKLMLDCIRAVYDPSAEYFRRSDEVITLWNFPEAGTGPSLAVKIAEPLNPAYRVNVEGIRRLFCVPQNLRPIIHLIADGGDFRLPMQFRFLSFYKIIEMHYKITSNKHFNEFIKPLLPLFDTMYPGITTVKELCAHLTCLRNRCAHIKLTTGDLGFSHFEAESDELLKAMPIIRRVAVKCISVNYPDSPMKFTATPEELAEQWAEMERRGEEPVRVV
jgi:hypothetical protein